MLKRCWAYRTHIIDILSLNPIYFTHVKLEHLVYGLQNHSETLELMVERYKEKIELKTSTDRRKCH